LDAAEAFEPVKIDLTTVKGALGMYQRHKKISMSKITGSQGVGNRDQMEGIKE